MIHSKKQILRSMRSYEVGGSTETCAIKPKPGCKQNKAAKKNKRQKTWRNVKEGVGKVLKIGVPAAALGVGAYLGSKLLKEQRNGGPVKRKK
jgi:hypothetical protein